MAENKCGVCGVDVSVRGIGVVEGVGLFCEECDKYYCSKHFEVGTTERICAGVDTEATKYYCPKGHRTWW